MSIEAMRQALEALEAIWEGGLDNYPDTAHERVMEALRQAIAEAEQAQPVWDASAPLVVHPHPAFQNTTPRRQPLTDEELAKVCGFGEYTTTSTRITLTHLARAIEQAHGIKGES